MHCPECYSGLSTQIFQNLEDVHKKTLRFYSKQEHLKIGKKIGL